MAGSPQPLTLAAGAERRLATIKFFRAVFRFAMDALARCNLPEREREDVAQEVVIAAWQAWPRDETHRGTRRRWLWGIVRRQVASFVRARRRQPPLVAGVHDE